MKEVKEWNNVPRDMWVWDGEDSSRGHKAHVVFIDPEVKKPGFPRVCVVRRRNGAWGSEWVCHCAELKEIGRIMTKKELARWIAEKPDREFLTIHANIVSHVYPYYDDEADEEADEDILIREGDGEWVSPLKEIVE